MFWTALAFLCFVLGVMGTIGSSILALHRLYKALFNRSEYTKMTVDEAVIIAMVLGAAYVFALMAAWGGAALDPLRFTLPAIQPSGTFGWL